MTTNEWVAPSQRLYRWLLRLYPRAYRASYEEEMFHLFTDQCREAYNGRGRRGIFSLWSRTLPDVGVSALREHLGDPHTRVGLLEAIPNAPLPWKGVLLVLIPGLIFFVSQIEQVTSTGDWFFLALYRAGFFLILPVLLVWLLTRRFPVWGLIPLGLLYRNVWGYGQYFSLERLPIIGHFFVKQTLFLFGTELCLCNVNYFLVVFPCVILLVLFIRQNVRSGRISAGAWKWLGLYGALIVLDIGGQFYMYKSWMGPESPFAGMFLELLLSRLYASLPFLTLIFIGMLLARKHGGLTFLLLLGYLLPTVVFGRYSNDQILPFALVSLAVLSYRFLVALVAPVWLVRAASVPGRQRAAAIPVAIAILCDISLDVAFGLAWVYYGSRIDPLAFGLDFLSQFIIAAGLGLAVTLYLPREKDQVIAPPSALVVAAE